MSVMMSKRLNLLSLSWAKIISLITLSTTSANTCLIIGQGDLGRRLKQSYSNLYGKDPLTWARTSTHHPDIEGPLGESSQLDISKIDTIVIIVSPVERTQAAYFDLYDRQLGAFLSQISHQKVIFVSSTVVYNSDGQWCHENSEVTRNTFRAMGILHAERHVRYYCPNNHVIYRLSRLIDTKVQITDCVWNNFVFRQDVVNILLATISNDKIKGTYNLSSTPQYYEQGKKLGKKLGKKVCNLKILSELDYIFRVE